MHFVSLKCHRAFKTCRLQAVTRIFSWSVSRPAAFITQGCVCWELLCRKLVGLTEFRLENVSGDHICEAPCGLHFLAPMNRHTVSVCEFNARGYVSSNKPVGCSLLCDWTGSNSLQGQTNALLVSSLSLCHAVPSSSGWHLPHVGGKAAWIRLVTSIQGREGWGLCAWGFFFASPTRLYRLLYKVLIWDDSLVFVIIYCS